MFSKRIRKVISFFLVVAIVGCIDAKITCIDAYSKELPSGYTQLEYVEFNSTSNSETMEIPFGLGSVDESYKWELTLSNLKKVNNAGSLVGLYDSGANIRTGYIYVTSSSNVGLAIGNNTYYGGAGSTTYLNDILDENNNTPFRITTTIGSGQFCTTETKSNKSMQNSYNGNLATNGTFLVTGCWTSNEFMQFKFYGVKIWDANGNLKVDMVPAKDTEGVLGAYDNITGNFYPKFKYGTSVSLSFDKQGGTGGDDSMSVLNGTAMGDIEVPTMDGKIFNGYYSAKGGKGTKYFDKDGKVVLNRAAFLNSSTTLYAYWTSENEEPAPAPSPTHAHEFIEGTITTPTCDHDGVGGIYCAMCGYIKETYPISAYSYALYEYATPMIKSSQPGQNVVFEFGEWNSFPKAFMADLAAKSAAGVTFEFHYKWNHEQQTIIIPAGVTVDLNEEWYGPAKMRELYLQYSVAQ